MNVMIYVHFQFSIIFNSPFFQKKNSVPLYPSETL